MQPGSIESAPNGTPAVRPAGVLQVGGVAKSFGPVRVLEDIGFELRPGEVHALVGGNGSGKSTILKILAGVYAADSGVLEVDDLVHDLRHADPSAARRAGLSFVHQEPTTFPELNVAENLSIGSGFETGALSRIQWKRVRERSAELLAQFNIPARPSDPMSSLSPASQMMVEIARALQEGEQTSRRFLLLDEPTAALAAAETELLFDTLRRNTEAGHSVVLISHRLEEILAIADRVTVIRDGRLVTTLPRQELDHDELVELIVGRKVETFALGTGAGTQGTEPLLEVNALCGGKLEQIDFTVGKGEIVGIAGLAGSGRSTLLRLLFGVQRHRSGSIRFAGRELAGSSPAAAIASGIGLVPEDRSADALLKGLSVEANISIVRVGEYWHNGLMQKRRQRRDAARLVDEYMVRAESPATQIEALSGGNQQKVVLARWMQRMPKLLLLDEPTQGVDVAARAEIWRMVQEAARGGTAALLVSSDVEELVHLATRILVFRDGRIHGELRTANLESADQVNQLLHEMAAAP